MLIFTCVLFLFFDQRGWKTWNIASIGISILVTIGFIVTLIDPQRFWWGMRLVTFVIFAGYLAYLLDEFWRPSHELEQLSRPSEASQFNSVLGFLFFGLPCLLYTFWGSTWGKLGHPEPESVSRSDVFLFYIAWGAQWLCLFLSVWAIGVVFFRS